MRWEITGSVGVDEDLSTRTATEARLLQRRQLAGIGVSVESRLDDDSPFIQRASGRTDVYGRFRLVSRTDAPASCIRVLISLSDTRLRVCRAGSPCVIEVAELYCAPNASSVDLGELVFHAGGAGALGEIQNIRRATTWYIARAVMSYLDGLGAGLRFTEPVDVGEAMSDEKNVRDILRPVMREWARQCGHARSIWPVERGVPRISRENADERFAELAMNELIASLWPTCEIPDSR